VDVVAAYDHIAGYLDVVHDNLGLVLNAMMATGQGFDRFDELKKVLPINNPLTRIIRMIGESRSQDVSGCLEVVYRIIQSGGFDHFMNAVIGIAKRRQRAAPQEVMGMLEVLARESRLGSWKAEDWQRLSEQIKKYYDSGFKVMTFTLFNYFRRHEDEPETLRTMKADIQNQLGNIGWGGFNGLSGEFKAKYGLTTEDELVLLSRYMTISNLTTRDYSGTYEATKEALKARGGDWKEEVDPQLRELFRFGGSRSLVVYEPEEADRFDVKTLHDKLVSYITESKQEIGKVLERYLTDPTPEAEELLKSALIQFAIKVSHLEAGAYHSLPTGDYLVQKWLLSWQSLIKDSLKGDAAKPLADTVRKVIDGLKADQAKSVLSNNKVPEFRSIKGKKDLLKVDNEMVAVFTDEGKTAEQQEKELADLFLNKWLFLMQSDEIRDRALFQRWINGGIDKFVRHILDKAGKKGAKTLKDADVRQMVSNALLKAREMKEEEVKGKTDLQRQQVMLANRISEKMTRLFDHEMADVAKELRGFKTVETETAEHFFVGFFDDLLHLMGLMQTGVCTYPSRARQVADTSFHFGKMAVKNSNGRLLGLSQVQLLRTPIANRPSAKSPKGWSVLSLPGINLYEGDIGMEREKAFHVLLESAQRYAEKTGMQGAAIPTNSAINTNHAGFEGRLITEYAQKGWLEKVKLTEKVVLSPDPYYEYVEVYLIKIPKENWILQDSSLTERVEHEKRATERLEKEIHMPLHGGLGEMIVEDPSLKPVADHISAEVTKMVDRMPKRIVEEISSTASIMDVAIRVKIDLAQPKSRVNKNGAEIELVIGGDIVYGSGKIEPITLTEMLGELLAAFILDDYVYLKEQAATNENAYFKLENVKALLTYQYYVAKYYKTNKKLIWAPANYLSEKQPAERRRILEELKENLDDLWKDAIKGKQKIAQWNLF